MKKICIVLTAIFMLVIWQSVAARPPEKPGNPGVPGLLAEIADLNAEIDELEAIILGLEFAPVPQTGQTECYMPDRTSIPCEDTGQDGEYRHGVPWPNPRFNDNLDGTVTDYLTGLIWLKDAYCFGIGNWSRALSESNGLEDGECGLTDGSSPGDWRLPNRKELFSLTHDEYYGNALPDTAGTGQWSEGDPFNNVRYSYYWSSTTYANDTLYAWYVNMYYGYVDPDTKGSSHYVWPVRGGH